MLRGKSEKEIRFSLRGKASGARLYALTTLAGLLAGTASRACSGIGGGTVLVPALAVFLGIDIVTAVATSLFVMAPSAAMAAYQHWEAGEPPPGACPSLHHRPCDRRADPGPRLSGRIPKNRLRQLFGLALLYAAVNMTLRDSVRSRPTPRTPDSPPA